MRTIESIRTITIRFEYNFGPCGRKDITVPGEKVIDMRVTEYPGKPAVAVLLVLTGDFAPEDADDERESPYDEFFSQYDVDEIVVCVSDGSETTYLVERDPNPGYYEDNLLEHIYLGPNEEVVLVIGRDKELHQLALDYAFGK